MYLGKFLKTGKYMSQKLPFQYKWNSLFAIGFLFLNLLIRIIYLKISLFAIFLYEKVEKDKNFAKML